jgi:integrase
MKRIRGMGRTLQRGKRWWISYYVQGQEQRESAAKVLGRPDAGMNEKDAEKALKIRLQEIHGGRWVGPKQERVTMAELLDGLVQDYKNNGRRSLSTLEAHLKPLRAVFPLDAALNVTEQRIERYKAERLEAKKAPATINRELAALRRAFALGVKQKRISQTPSIELLAENNARQGFAEPGDFERVVAHLPEYLQDFARFAYASGWRKGELKTLEWSVVDRDNTRVTLRREHSKNGEPRVLPLIGELAEIIGRRRQAREFKTPTGESGLSTLVFHLRGQPVGDFRKAWAAACIGAGFSRAKVDDAGRPVVRNGETVLEAALLFHDLRRSAVRNLYRDGITQSVAMAITGHKTASVYRRYRIVNEDDIRLALERVQKGNRARKVVKLATASV